MKLNFVTRIAFLSVLILFWIESPVFGATNADDFAVLDEFRKGLKNPELLQWPENGQDPCGEKWNHVYCHLDRVTQIQVKELGLIGTLPQNLRNLSMLINIGLQRNNFSGKLPSFSGLSNLQYAYLGGNQFDSIPMDFFVGLDSLQVLILDYNPLNESTGWMLPSDLVNSAQLMNLSLIGCNLVGALPDFLGGMRSMNNLKLSYNKHSGEIPVSYSGLPLQLLWLNNQNGKGLSGPIDVVMSMTQLKFVWLHGNQFTGSIPSSIGKLTALTELRVDNNKLVGLIPDTLMNLPQLTTLQVGNNLLMGPIPKASFTFTYDSNSFCQQIAGAPCSPEVTALLEFLEGINYPLKLADSWSGNDPCNSWVGVSCYNNNVSAINLSNRQLNGTISSSIAKLGSLVNIILGSNNLSGTIPSDLTSLKSLVFLNLSSNDISPPIPHFSPDVKVLLDGNKLLENSSDSSSNNGSYAVSPSSSGGLPPSPKSPNGSKDSTNFKIIVSVVVVVSVLLFAALFLFLYYQMESRKSISTFSRSIWLHPRDFSDPNSSVKITISGKARTSVTSSEVHSINNNEKDMHIIGSGKLVVSVQVLRGATQDFAPENVLGHGGFGVVYKGKFDDGQMIAVKRMESESLNRHAISQFAAEIEVLTTVRHRNLVSILGYSQEGHERLLVYEYMPQGDLSRHLFHWKQQELEPLCWKKRITIALDVARGMEYLHNLAHRCFIHRDLKSSNILLGDDYRAKVSDFGLAKLASDEKSSVATKIAGTFGYLAPEYAVTGRLTRKADVFSFGVVLMELVSGLVALDEDRPEESRYLVPWFCHINTSKENLKSIIDPSIAVTDEEFESICILAELASHCAAYEPLQRPDMSEAVNIIAKLAHLDDKWSPVNNARGVFLGVNKCQPLLDMVKEWQEADNSPSSSPENFNESKGFIPVRPAGFAVSFSSIDAR